MQTSGSLRLRRRLCPCLRLRLCLRHRLRLRLRLLLFSAQFLFLLSVFESVCPRRDATRSHANHVLSLTVSLLLSHSPSLSSSVYRTLSETRRAEQELLPQSNAHWACPLTASGSADLSLSLSCSLLCLWRRQRRAKRQRQRQQTMNARP